MPTPDAPVRVGTRGSPLALAQTELALSRLRAAHPGVAFELVIVTTQGDADRTAPLAGMGLGVFVSEIERRLATGDIDLAVHSLKDLPSTLPDGMAIGAIPERADPRDALVSHLGHSLAQLPAGARIGTSSPRRAAQIAGQRPDLTIVPIRGNVETRLRKAAGAECDAAILAAAGLHRLNLPHAITEYLPPEQFVPPPGQGALAVEIRAADARMAALVAAAHHPPTAAAVAAERAFLALLGGGCQVPVGAYARYPGDHPGDDDDHDHDHNDDDDRRRLNLTAYLAAPDGAHACRATAAGNAADAPALAAAAWRLLRQQGAAALLPPAPPPASLTHP